MAAPPFFFSMIVILLGLLSYIPKMTSHLSCMVLCTCNSAFPITNLACRGAQACRHTTVLSHTRELYWTRDRLTGTAVLTRQETGSQVQPYWTMDRHSVKPYLKMHRPTGKPCLSNARFQCKPSVWERQRCRQQPRQRWVMTAPCSASDIDESLSGGS